MTYSCSDFTDDVLNQLGIVVPDDAEDGPEAGAKLAIVKIARLQGVCAAALIAYKAVLLHGQKLDDPHGDGSGDDAESPGGDDYKEVVEETLQPLFDALNAFMAEG